MIENLAWLPSVNPPSDGSQTVRKYYVSGYAGTDVDTAKGKETFATYGVLYNRPAALDGCPSGWHLSSDLEWINLEKRLGMILEYEIVDAYRCSGSVGGKLKETGTEHWASPNVAATNSYGFTALPGGYMGEGGQFVQFGTDAWFWATKVGEFACVRNLFNLSDGVYRWCGASHAIGFSVRCIRD